MTRGTPELRLPCFLLLGLTAACWPYDPATNSIPELSLLGLVGPCIAQESGFAGGTGQSSDPYQICNATMLQAMADGLALHYQVSSSFDAGETAAWNSGAGFVPVGTAGSPFTGSLSGQSLTISGLYINPGSSDCGLFGYLSGSSVSNLTLTNVTVSGTSGCGTLAGSASGATISNITVVNPAVTGTGILGGVVGDAANTTLTRIFVSGGSVTGSSNELGGIVGRLRTGTAVVSQSYGNTTVNYTGTGGINFGIIAGLLGNGGGGNGIMQDCYAAGTVNAPNASAKVGGLLGHSWLSAGIYRSYSVAQVISSGTLVAGGVGALQGSSFNDSYCLDVYDIDVDTNECWEQNGGGGATGTARRTAAQLRCPTFAGENCSGATTYGAWSSSVWNFGDSGTLPTPL